MEGSLSFGCESQSFSLKRAPSTGIDFFKRKCFLFSPTNTPIARVKLCYPHFAYCCFKPRGIHGEHSESTGEDAGVFDISNRRRLGLSEVQCVQDMYNGVKKLLEIEKAAIAYVLMGLQFNLLSRCLSLFHRSDELTAFYLFFLSARNSKSFQRDLRDLR